MQRFEVSGAVRPIYGSLGIKRLNQTATDSSEDLFQYSMPLESLLVIVKKFGFHKRIATIQSNPQYTLHKLHPNLQTLCSQLCMQLPSQPRSLQCDATVYEQTTSLHFFCRPPEAVSLHSIHQACI